jgi:hypothetical protein
LLEVQGMNLERYATLRRLLEPFGGRLQSVDGDRIVYRVNGSADQLRAQLSLAKLQELPAEPTPAPAPCPARSGRFDPAVAPAPVATPQLHFAGRLSYIEAMEWFMVDTRRWFWLGGVVLLCAFVWLLHPILTPFLVALLLAYLFDPLVDRLEKAGLSRTLGVVAVFALFT